MPGRLIVFSVNVSLNHSIGPSWACAHRSGSGNWLPEEIGVSSFNITKTDLTPIFSVD